MVGWAMFQVFKFSKQDVTIILYTGWVKIDETKNL